MFTISVVRWPPRYFSEMHTKIRRDAKAMIIHGHVPNVKHGGKVNPIMKESFQDYVAFSRKKNDKTTFLPAGVKTKKAQFNVNESFGGSMERWDSQKAKESGRKKDSYIKSRPIDHDAIIKNMNVPFEILKVIEFSQAYMPLIWTKLTHHVLLWYSFIWACSSGLSSYTTCFWYFVTESRAFGSGPS